MPVWREFPWNAIEGYLKDFMWGEAPVFWELETESAPGMPLRGESALVGYPGVTMRRRTDSLALEISFSGSQQAMVAQPEGNILAQVASLEDNERILAASSEPLASGVISELETEVPSGSNPNRRLRPIGPGGRAVAFRLADRIAADVVIRRRRLSLPGAWRAPGEILSRVRCDCPENSPGVRVRAAFGYFELSKYEMQRLLRPAFLFSIEQPQDEEGRWPGWMTTLLEPATTAPGIELDEGVGLWSE